MLIGNHAVFAFGHETTGTFQVTTTVEGTCTVTANDLSFGTYISGQPDPLNQTSDIVVTCSNGTDYTIALDDGSHPDGHLHRRMSGPNDDAMPYSLYADSSHESSWGDQNGEILGSTGNGYAQTQTVYGYIPASLTHLPGQYQDTVTVTVAW
jgi:spore coat protein U-like protein